MGRVHFKHCDKRLGKPRAPVSLAQLKREGRLAKKKPGKKLFNTVQGAFNELKGLIRADQKVVARIARLKSLQVQLPPKTDLESDDLKLRRAKIAHDLTAAVQAREDIRQRTHACRAKLASRI